MIYLDSVQQGPAFGCFHVVFQAQHENCPLAAAMGVHPGAGMPPAVSEIDQKLIFGFDGIEAYTGVFALSLSDIAML